MQGYEIWVQGQLDLDWAEWFDDFTLTHRPEGITVLTGLVVDQAALHGILNKIRNLGLTLISVNQVPQQLHDTERTEEAQSPQRNKLESRDWRLTGCNLQSLLSKSTRYFWTITK